MISTQIAILGPSLFLIRIHYIFNSCDICKYIMAADDTIIV